MQSQSPEMTIFRYLGVAQWPGNCLVQGSTEKESITFFFFFAKYEISLFDFHFQRDLLQYLSSIRRMCSAATL